MSKHINMAKQKTKKRANFDLATYFLIEKY